jgi:DNA-binding XRE family transcriptional regulator
VDPFTNYLKFDQTAGKIRIPLIIQPFKELTQDPVSLGDHLRRRRIELGLYQKDVAVQIGVTASTIWNWEHGWAIGKRYVSQIITFIGCNPVPHYPSMVNPDEPSS